MQGLFPDIDPFNTNGIELADLLNDFKNSVASTHSGVTRPAEILAGGLWIDTVDAGDDVLYLKMYDGTVDILLFTFDLVAGTGQASGSSKGPDGTFAIPDNQASPTDVTGLIIDPLTYSGAEISYMARRTSRREMGKIFIWNDPTEGPQIARSDIMSFDGTDVFGDGFGLTIDSDGQVQITTDSHAVGTLQWKILTQFEVE